MQDRHCGSCGQPIQANDRFCRSCGVHAGVSLPMPFNPTPRYYDPQYAEPKDNSQTALINFMWLLTAAEVLLTLAYGTTAMALTVLLDIPALILALVLVFSGKASGLKHGLAKLFLELIGFLIGFAAATHR